MTDDEIIAAQAREIIGLRGEMREMRNAMNRVVIQIVCVGGPLNDNKLHYTPQQLVIFKKIVDELEDL